MTARVVVVGLGPAGADLLLPAARRALEEAPLRFVRTAHHPAVEELAARGLAFVSLDHHYDAAPDLDAAYSAIVADVERAARGGSQKAGADVVYAVPGNPGVAERTVAMLRAIDGIEVEVIPGLSFAELAWARLGVDPLDGGRIADARTLDRETLLLGGPLLISQCDSPAVLSDVKLALLESLPPDAPVTVASRLGLPDERVETVALEDLDRGDPPDHLTSVFVDVGAAPGDEFARFVALIERLRGPGGCPWDAEQTHHSLTRHLVEEAYEVIEALEALPPEAPDGPVDPALYAHVQDELGDLAAQVVFHATLAREAGAFTTADVLRGIREKLVHRHPHVFGDPTGRWQAEGAGDVMRNWEQIKAEEKASEGGAKSFVADVPAGLPALLYAHKLLRKAASAGLPAMSAGEAAAAIGRAASHLEEVDGQEAVTLVGDLLAAVALVAREKGFDAETALRAWSARFRERFLALEALAAERGLDLGALPPDTMGALWIESHGTLA